MLLPQTPARIARIGFLFFSEMEMEHSAAAVNFSAAAIARGVALGDLNGNGNVDLAVANGNNVSYLYWRWFGDL